MPNKTKETTCPIVIKWNLIKLNTVAPLPVSLTGIKKFATNQAFFTGSERAQKKTSWPLVSTS